MKKLLLSLPIVTLLLTLATSQALATCSYGSTQARVQVDRDHAWSQNLSVGCENRFNIGSFHDQTGQFASDTTLEVSGPTGFSTQSYAAHEGNGRTIAANYNGTYTLKVTTNNQDGSACTESTTVNVSCSSNNRSTPTSTLTPTPSSSCSYSSTQSRIQKDTNDPWKSSLSIGCFEHFNVGSFHNNSGQFATDTTITITGNVSIPFFGNRTIERTANNGNRIRAFFPGTYKVKATTNNQSGNACTEESTVSVNCSDWSELTNLWKLK